MREIKFRAWHIERKFMGHCLEVSLLNGYAVIDLDNIGNMGGSETFRFKECSFFKNAPIEIKLMQYTGLKDCNGKEIYEGDIIELNNGYLFNVEWHQEECKFALFHNCCICWCFDEAGEMKVIGKIYENQELLENE